MGQREGERAREKKQTEGKSVLCAALVAVGFALRIPFLSSSDICC